MNRDFYMYYRMRTSMTFSVRGDGTFNKPYSVKVVISDDEKTFEKAAIFDLKAYSAGKAIDAVMNILLDIEDHNVKTAEKKSLEEWDNY